MNVWNPSNLIWCTVTACKMIAASCSRIHLLWPIPGTFTILLYLLMGIVRLFERATFKNRAFLFIFFAIFSTGQHRLYAQKSDIGNWFIYFGNQQINERWNWWNEMQYRNFNFIGDLEQLVFRTGIGYNLTENNNNVLLGYAFIYAEPYIPGTDKKTSRRKTESMNSLLPGKTLVVYSSNIVTE